MATIAHPLPRTGPRGWAKRHPVASFFALAYALSWLAWLLPALGVGGAPGLVALVAGTFGPALAAVILTWSTGASVREWVRGIIRWRVHPRWYLVAFGLPIVTVGLESSIVALLGHQIEPALIPGRLAGYIPALALTALLQGGNEEPGWRGFALPRLQERHPPVAATLVLASSGPSGASRCWPPTPTPSTGSQPHS